MVFAVPVEGWEHDGEDGGGVVAYQAHDIPANLLSDIHLAISILALQAQLILLLWILVGKRLVSNSLIVPVVECSFSHLEMWTADTLGQLVEEGHHHLENKLASTENLAIIKMRPSETLQVQ